jgi:hypothetical protein
VGFSPPRQSGASRLDYDALYHRLFSHPGIVGQLLIDFIGGPGGAGIDLGEVNLEGMERLNAKFHAHTGQRREGDMIWRIPRRDGEDTYLVLLLEFQSTSDQMMAVRVMTYASLLWQHLADEKRLPAHGKLPPLLPVVLYNGDGRWRAPESVRDLIGLNERSTLWRWQPELRYHLIDVGTFSQAELESRASLLALWFRLENASDPGELVAVADAVLAWLSRHPGYAAAQAAFVELLGATMAPLRPGLRVPGDLLEVRNMLATRAEKWIQGWLLEGEQKGRQEGEQKGRQQGEAAFLLRQLTRRFGALPGWTRDRVLQAEPPALEEWGLRVLDGGSLEEILGPPDRQA